MFNSKLKIKLFNNKAISNNSGNKVGSKKNSSKIAGNSRVEKFRKKLIKLKSGNLAKSMKIAINSATEIRLSFLIFTIRKVFKQLQLVFTKTSILHYFYLKCYIQIEAHILG